ncbi:MAG: nucleotidyltransferase family protein [Nitrospirales bacterium]|nr:nucleotidyltransferase family protein [Nitrospirales bacterium]
MTFSVEEQLLLALAKPYADERDLAQGEAVRSLTDFNWPSALCLARAHWILPMLAWNLNVQEQVWGDLPKAVRTELGVAMIMTQQRRSLYHAGLAPVFEGLQAQDICFTLMKGAVVMETVYPQNTRLLNDLDLLIPLDSCSRAVNIFIQNGFQALSAMPDPVVRHQLSLVKGRGVGSLSVDLHWDVYPKGRPFHFKVEEVFARATLQNFGDSQVLGMSPEDTFVHYATQLVNDGFHHAFVRFCDLYGLVAVGLDQQRLESIARTTGATGITHTALTAVRLMGGRVSQDFLDKLAKGHPGCRIATDFLLSPEWLFGRKRLAYGSEKFIAGLYFSDSVRRRRYWCAFPRSVYDNVREQGYSNPMAFFQMVHALLSALLCGGLLLLAAPSPVGIKRSLRKLLWRKSS